jgi:hypothetical protein
VIINRFFTIVVEPIVPQPEKGRRYSVVVTPYKRNGLGPVAAPGDLLIWDVVGNGNAVVSLRGFKPKGKPDAPALRMMGKAGDRRTDRRNGRIIDGVSVDADTGTYKYDILVDGRVELDPEIRIRESD